MGEVIALNFGGEHMACVDVTYKASEFVTSSTLTDCNAFTTSVFIGVISLTLSLAGLTTSYT